MATEYISREAAYESLNRIKSYLHQPHPEYSTMMFWEVEDFIDTLPAADVRPVKIGHYVTDEMGDSSCSECGEKYLDITKRFCPECGAELRRNDGDQ